MKLQQKLLAALLAVAFTGGAHAAIDNSTSGNGSLVLGVIDTIGQKSAAFDLGINMDSFQPGSTSFQSWNLSAANFGTAWSQFVTAVGANLATSKYFVFAMDSVGAAVGTDRFLSTSAADMTVAANQASNTQLLNFVGASGGSGVDLHVNGLNLLGTHGAQADGANFAAAADGNAYAGNANAFGTQGKWKASQSPFVVWGNVNTALDIYSLSNSSAVGPAGKATHVAYNDFAQDFYLNSTTGTLTYGVQVAAIPEADTWAMFAAGLLAVGAIARRRMQA